MQKYVFLRQYNCLRASMFMQLIEFLHIQTSSRVLETGVNTLQKTLVLKKQAELEEVDKQLVLKRQEFKSRVEALAQRRSQLEAKQQQVDKFKERISSLKNENSVTLSTHPCDDGQSGKAK